LVVPSCVSSRWRSWPLVLTLLIGALSIATHASGAAPALVLDASQVAEASALGTLGTTPIDGRLRGPDFTAVVTHVVWPQSVSSPSGTSYVAGTGRRLVAFTLSVTQASANAGIDNASTGVDARLEVASSSLPISMSPIDQQIAGGTSGTAQTTGTDSFVVSVPARAHDVALSLNEGGFGQSFDLWTLRRTPPSPVVLYRDPASPTVTGTAAGPFHLSFTNPADGYSSSDDAQVQSATLSYFSPGASPSTPGNPDQALLVVGLQSSYPSVAYGQPGWGHFFSDFTPLAGNRLTFTPSGGSAVTATADTADFSSTAAANDDDGIFDALYAFTVPATTTGGTLAVAAGTATGIEYTGFTGLGAPGPISVTQPATVDLSFPAVPAPPPHQKTPPWVGAALPSTGLSAAAVSSTGSGTSSGSSGVGFPIWVVVLILVLVAAAVVAVQRFHRRPAAETATASAVDKAVAPAQRATTAQRPPSVDEEAEAVAHAVPVAVAAPEPPRSLVLGPPGARGMRKDSDRRIIEELFHYLALHDTHRRSAEQILVALRPHPGPSDDLSRKSVHTYLSELRTCVGVEHLPSAAIAGGYLLEGHSSDWEDFQDLLRQADASGDGEARALRTDALALVRGEPFAGVAADTYQWVGAEHLASTMTRAIARCGSAQAEELLAQGDSAGAEEAARSALRGAPEDFELWRVGAAAIDARGDRSALRLWMADAGEHLEPAEIHRIEEELGPHDDSPGDET
jgi:hypothetical protein